jgi:hypothetical protein
VKKSYSLSNRIYHKVSVGKRKYLTTPGGCALPVDPATRRSRYKARLCINVALARLITNPLASGLA